MDISGSLTATVTADATFAFAQRDYHHTTRTADEVHAMSLANLQGEYATVLDAAALRSLLSLNG